MLQNKLHIKMMFLYCCFLFLVITHYYWKSWNISAPSFKNKLYQENCWNYIKHKIYIKYKVSLFNRQLETNFDMNSKKNLSYFTADYQYHFIFWSKMKFFKNLFFVFVLIKGQGMVLEEDVRKLFDNAKALNEKVGVFRPQR